MLGHNDSYKNIFTNRSRGKSKKELSRYEVVINDKGCNIDIPDNNIWLEIGFGNGDHLYNQITLNLDSDIFFIGADPFTDGAASFAKKLYNYFKETNNNYLENKVKIYNGAAGHLLDYIKDNSVNMIFILFPDPWYKKRHNKRRIMSDEFLNELHRVLNKNGCIRFATDHKDYIEEVEDLLKNKMDKWNYTDIIHYKDNWPKTKFQQKAVNDCLAIEIFKK